MHIDNRDICLALIRGFKMIVSLLEKLLEHKKAA